MGDSDGISRGSGFGDAGILCAVAGTGTRGSGSLAGDRGSGPWGWNLRGCPVRLSARGVWHVSSELFLLRSEFVFVYAAAGVFGVDLSASGPAVEDSGW